MPHGMSSSAVVRPSAASPAKNDSDQAVPLLSKSSWVDQIGVVGDEAGLRDRDAEAAEERQHHRQDEERHQSGRRNTGRHNADAYLFTLMSRSSWSGRGADVTVTRATLPCNILIYTPQVLASRRNYTMCGPAGQQDAGSPSGGRNLDRSLMAHAS